MMGHILLRGSAAFDDVGDFRLEVDAGESQRRVAPFFETLNAFVFKERVGVRLQFRQNRGVDRRLVAEDLPFKRNRFQERFVGRFHRQNAVGDLRVRREHFVDPSDVFGFRFENGFVREKRFRLREELFRGRVRRENKFASVRLFRDGGRASGGGSGSGERLSRSDRFHFGNDRAGSGGVASGVASADGAERARLRASVGGGQREGKRDGKRRRGGEKSLRLFHCELQSFACRC